MTLAEVAEQMLREAHRLPASETGVEGFNMSTEVTASDGNRYAVIVERSEGAGPDFNVRVEPVEGSDHV